MNGDHLFLAGMKISKAGSWSHDLQNH